MADLRAQKAAGKTRARKSLKRGEGSRTKEPRSPAARFEIVRPSPDPDYWSSLRSILSPLADAARNALGDAYASVAKVVAERVEEFEDRNAERKAARRTAVRTVAVGEHLPKTRLIESGPSHKKRRISLSQTNV